MSPETAKLYKQRLADARMRIAAVAMSMQNERQPPVIADKVKRADEGDAYHYLTRDIFLIYDSILQAEVDLTKYLSNYGTL